MKDSDPGVALYKSEITKENDLHEQHATKLKLSVEAEKIGESKLVQKLREEAKQIRDLAQKKHAYILELRKKLEIEDVRLEKGGMF